MQTRREWIVLVGSALAAQEDAKFSTEVRVVNVLATVRNKRGEIIRDLKKEDFTLLESGRPQEIRYFATQSDLPLTIGLLVDTSMSQERVLAAERSASFRFLDQVLRENKDKVFLMQFDAAVRLRKGFTSSRRELEEALTLVDTPSRAELRRGAGGGTLLFDAVVTASKDYMARQQGRKALIVLSDGVDFGSDSPVMDAIEHAQRADTLIYSILFADSHAYGGFSISGRGPMQKMARETGGAFYEVTKKLGIEQIFDGIQDELRSQYSMGYVSDQRVSVSEFRKIQLVLKDKGLVVQSRDRYWAQR